MKCKVFTDCEVKVVYLQRDTQKAKPPQFRSKSSALSFASNIANVLNYTLKDETAPEKLKS